MIVAVALLLLLASPAFAQKEKVADAKVITKVADTYFGVFRAAEDGEEITSTLTAEVFELVTETGQQPATDHLPPGKTWTFAYGAQNDVYDTPSGAWEVGNIYVQGDGTPLLIVPDEAPFPLDAAIYTISIDAVKGVSIVPDPPGLSIKDGELSKDVGIIEVPGGGEIIP